MDRVTRIPTHVEDSKAMGSFAPIALNHGIRVSFEPKPMSTIGGYKAVTGSSMPHHTEQTMPTPPMREVPRAMPRIPAYAGPVDPYMEIPGAKKVITDPRPM